MTHPKSVLVTGGAGFIGSHVCKRLAQKGYFPVTLDNLSNGHADAVRWGPLVEQDLRETHLLRQVLATYQPIAVMHFAADAYVAESVKNPGKYYQNNVTSTLSLLEALNEQHINCLIFSSTCATYGEPQTIPIDETHPQNPVSPYGKSKWMVEQILKDFEKAHGLRFASLRYFNAAGADPDGDIGEEHTPETHLIPSILQTALGLRPQLVVYGTDFPTADGSAIRDYIHVQDLAEAHVLALEYLLATSQSIELNLGTGQGFSVLQILQAAESICQKPLEVLFEKARPGEPAQLIANATRAQNLLQWKPRLSDLDSLLKTAWHWQKSLLHRTPLSPSLQ